MTSSVGRSEGFFRRQWRRIRRKKQKAAGTAAVGLYIAFAWAFDIPCFYMRTFGLPCPGCGLTRAWLHALHGDLRTAVVYHPLFWAVIPLYLYILFDGSLFRGRWLDRTVLILLAIGFAVLEIFRLADPDLRAILY